MTRTVRCPEETSLLRSHKLATPFLRSGEEEKAGSTSIQNPSWQADQIECLQRANHGPSTGWPRLAVLHLRSPDPTPTELPACSAHPAGWMGWLGTTGEMWGT